MYYLDLVSSYFCVVGLLWFIMIIFVKFAPSILKQGKEMAAILQAKLLLLSIPLSFLLGYFIFHFLNIYEYMSLV